MLDWMSPMAFLQTMIRVAAVWLAFYGAGVMLRTPLRINKIFPLLPSELVGLLAFVFLSIPLSLLGLLNRTVCPIIILAFCLPGILFTYGELRNRLSWKKPPILQVIFGLLLFFILILNLTYASMPGIAFDDPLITYAVQPDRWLNEGGVHWLEETVFSGFPLLYEMTAVWPASLSADRIDQLSILQFFQMTMLILAVIRGLGILRIRKSLWIPVLSIVLLTTALYSWCSLAKTDTLAILFTTLALASAVRQKQNDFKGSPLTPWLLMGITLAVKQTAIIVLPAFFLYVVRDFLRYSLKWKALALAALIFVPGAYAVRTMAKTGSPTYPFYPVNSMLNEEWQLNKPEENATVNDRSSSMYDSRNFGLVRHIGSESVPLLG